MKGNTKSPNTFILVDPLDEYYNTMEAKNIINSLGTLIAYILVFIFRVEVTFLKYT